jgi:hypothetical protein
MGSNPTSPRRTLRASFPRRSMSTLHGPPQRRRAAGVAAHARRDPCCSRRRREACRPGCGASTRPETPRNAGPTRTIAWTQRAGSVGPGRAREGRAADPAAAQRPAAKRRDSPSRPGLSDLSGRQARWAGSVGPALPRPVRDEQPPPPPLASGGPAARRPGGPAARASPLWAKTTFFYFSDFPDF